MKNLAVLGATGSIGDSTLKVIRKHPDKFNVTALSAHSNVDKIIQLAHEFEPKHVVITDETAVQKVVQGLADLKTHVYGGINDLNSIVSDTQVDLVVAGIVGNAGMESVLAAVEAGKTLLLANKESLVVAGELVMPLAKKTNATIIPLDSEHNAIFQCLGIGYETGVRPDGVNSITLTASGGPFWQTDAKHFKSITPSQAVAHPKWNMGAKISVDSATLMNKGLEVIEAHWLFNIASEDIKVLVHPQSIIHSMVNFLDGSVLAQMGSPDMQIPISHGLGLGQRLGNDADFLDLLQQQQLTFYQADSHKFKCLQLARDALLLGGTAAAILNAANEISVASFLKGLIRFDQIAQINDRMMNAIESANVESVAQLKDLDHEVRIKTEAAINSK